MHRDLSDLRDDNREIIKRYNRLAKTTGNEHLAFDFISDELKREIIQLLEEGNESEAIYLVSKNTKMDLEKCKEFISNLE